MKINATHVLGTAAVLTAAIGANADSPVTDALLRDFYNQSVRYTDAIEFPQRVSGDVDLGRRQFGISDDDTQIAITSDALFVGHSVIAGDVGTNGRACSSCHRPENHFTLGSTPLSAHIPADDPAMSGVNADTQGDPRGPDVWNRFGLMEARPGRFNPTIPESSPYRRLVAWRKTQTILNMTFGFGLLTDGRARHSLEQARAAAMSHPRPDASDKRDDDIVNPKLPNIGAYQESEIDPPALRALLDPSDPDFERLTTDPFATVPITTRAQARGRDVFERSCMGCHNMPNVFGNRDHVMGPPANFPPLYGHTFDVGVAQANRHHLDFRAYDAATGGFDDVVLPLVREDGAVVPVKVVDDPGAAGATGRYEDLHRFKVPQLRNIKNLAPYFHDNSAATLEDVVDYFNGDDYNRSIDGRRFPIHLSRDERADLLEFLRAL